MTGILELMLKVDLFILSLIVLSCAALLLIVAAVLAINIRTLQHHVKNLSTPQTGKDQTRWNVHDEGSGDNTLQLSLLDINQKRKNSEESDPERCVNRTTVVKLETVEGNETGEEIETRDKPRGQQRASPFVRRKQEKQSHDGSQGEGKTLNDVPHQCRPQTECHVIASRDDPIGHGGFYTALKENQRKGSEYFRYMPLQFSAEEHQREGLVDEEQLGQENQGHVSASGLSSGFGWKQHHCKDNNAKESCSESFLRDKESTMIPDMANTYKKQSCTQRCLSGDYCVILPPSSGSVHGDGEPDYLVVLQGDSSAKEPPKRPKQTDKPYIKALKSRVNHGITGTLGDSGWEPVKEELASVTVDLDEDDREARDPREHPAYLHYSNGTETCISNIPQKSEENEPEYLAVIPSDQSANGRTDDLAEYDKIYTEYPEYLTVLANETAKAECNTTEVILSQSCKGFQSGKNLKVIYKTSAISQVSVGSGTDYHMIQGDQSGKEPSIANGKKEDQNYNPEVWGNSSGIGHYKRTCILHGIKEEEETDYLIPTEEKIRRETMETTMASNDNVSGTPSIVARTPCEVSSAHTGATNKVQKLLEIFSNEAKVEESVQHKGRLSDGKTENGNGVECNGTGFSAERNNNSPQCASVVYANTSAVDCNKGRAEDTKPEWPDSSEPIYFNRVRTESNEDYSSRHPTDAYPMYVNQYEALQGPAETCQYNDEMYPIYANSDGRTESKDKDGRIYINRAIFQ